MLFIFDCDGTLVDSEVLNNTAMSELLVAEGFTDYTPQRCMDLFTGVSLEDCLTFVRKKEGMATFIDSEMVRKYVALTLNNMDRDLRSDPMTVPILTELRKKGADMVVASNGELDVVRETIKVAGLSEFFPHSHIFTKNMVANPKPDPDLFLFAIRKMRAQNDY